MKCTRRWSKGLSHKEELANSNTTADLVAKYRKIQAKQSQVHVSVAELSDDETQVRATCVTRKRPAEAQELRPPPFWAWPAFNFSVCVCVYDGVFVMSPNWPTLLV